MSQIAEAFVRVRPNMTGFKAEAERETKSAFSGIGKIIGGSFAAVGIGEAVKKVAQAAAAQQEELVVVRQAVKSTSSAWIVHGKTVDDTLREMAVKFGITVADLAQGFTRIQVSTKNTPKTFKLLDEAMDISRARHLGLAQAAVVVAKAQAGNVTGLQRLGIVIPKVTAAQDALKTTHEKAAAAGAKFTKEEEYAYKQHLLTAKAIDLQSTKAKIQLEIQGRFGGQAAAFAKTAEGSAQRFHEAVNEFEVSVGSALIPTLTRAASVGTRWFQELAHSAGIHHAVAATARELAQGFSLVWSIIRVLGPPLGVVVHALGQVAGFAGGGGIVAFALGFKSLSIAAGLAGAAEARYNKILAAGRGEQVAAATAEEAHAASMTALVTALDANTAALAANATAYDVQSVAAASSAEATGLATAAFEASTLRSTESGILLASNVRSVEGVANGAGVALGGLARNTEEVGVKAATIGSRLSGLGRGLFAMAGGWTTVGAVALGVLAFGIYKIATAESAWDSANKRVASSLNALAGSLAKVAQLRDRLANLKTSIGGDKDTIAQDRLNVAFAARAVTAPKGTLEYKQQVQNVLSALHELHRAEKQLDDDRKSRDTTAAGLAYKHQQALNTAAKSAKILDNATKEALTPRAAGVGGKTLTHFTLDPVTGKYTQAGKEVRTFATESARAQAEADRFGDAIVKNAEKVKGPFAKTIQRNAEILKAYAHQLGHLPKPAESRIILSNVDAKRTLASFEADFANKTHALAAKARPDGLKIGVAVTGGIAAGIRGGSGTVFSALDVLLTGIVTRSKTKLKAHSPSDVMRDEVGHSMSDGIALGILDRNGKVVGALESQLQQAIQSGVQQVKDSIIQAKQNLNAIGGSLAGDIGSILDRRAQAGLDKPSGAAKKALDALLKQIHEGKAGPDTASLAQTLQNQLVEHASVADPQIVKDKITRRIADLTDLVNRGSITGPQFERKIDAILKANKIRPADVEKRFGPALADQLRADRQSLREQRDAIAAGPDSKYGAAGLATTIIKPLDALKQVQQQIGQAQLSETKKQTAEAKKQTTELQKANGLAKGKATSADISQLIKAIEKNPGNPQAWKPAARNRTHH